MELRLTVKDVFVAETLEKAKQPRIATKNNEIKSFRIGFEMTDNYY